MGETHKGILALFGSCVLWGTLPGYFSLLTEVPPMELLAHRMVWALIFFAALLALQGRLGVMRSALTSRASLRRLVPAALLISINWFLLIYATQVDMVTQSSLGYYIFPLLAVVLGRLFFDEQLQKTQVAAVGLATAAVLALTIGLGVVPWLSLTIAITFALYGAIKKTLDVGPIVSVTCEALLLLPFVVLVLVQSHVSGDMAFGRTISGSLLLMGAGVLTALPLMLFNYGARRVRLSTAGVLLYLNPTLQFVCALVIFGETLTTAHMIAFPMIWLALIIYSVSALRQDRAARRAVMAASGASTTVNNSASEASAKP